MLNPKSCKTQLDEREQLIYAASMILGQISLALKYPNDTMNSLLCTLHNHSTARYGKVTNMLKFLYSSGKTGKYYVEYVSQLIKYVLVFCCVLKKVTYFAWLKKNTFIKLLDSLYMLCIDFRG